MENIRVTDLTNRHGDLVSRVHNTAAHALHVAGKSTAALDIFLVSTVRMQALNKTSRGINKSTNVLSFTYKLPVPHPEYGKTYRGEIYLCPAHIIVQNENLDLMVIHGVLHLFGYNHQTDAGASSMERMERKILRSMHR